MLRAGRTGVINMSSAQAMRREPWQEEGSRVAAYPVSVSVRGLSSKGNPTRSKITGAETAREHRCFK